MRYTQKLAAISLLILLGGCAVHREGSGTEEYVEIPNPAITMSPNAPDTIWVPRSYVDSGVPRGGDLVKKGVASLHGTLQPASPREQTAAVRSAASLHLKSRIAILEIGDNGLLTPFSDKMTNAAVGVVLASSQSAPLAKNTDLGNHSGRAALAQSLQQQLGATIVVFILAPDQGASGGSVRVEIYDGMAGELLRTVSAAIAPFSRGNAAERDSALEKALSEIVEKTKTAVTLLPWYGKVVAVDGDRVYINAGSEAGLEVGQVLKLHRPGKVVAGLGFAPGDRNGTLEITGLVGTNGAYGVVSGGKGVQMDDPVTVQ